MTMYAWTISMPGRQDIKKTTDLDELRDVLRVLDPPGGAPVEFVTPDATYRTMGPMCTTKAVRMSGLVTWAKVDGETEVVE